MKDSIVKFNEMRGIGDCSKVCHAPFQSLYFGQTGGVVACCYNRKNILGRYPDESIMDIWTGSKATEMREGMLSDSSLPMGCDNCADQLIAENFMGLHAKKYDVYSAPSEEAAEARLVDLGDRGKVAFPKLIEFELSNACNLECVMCHGGFSSSIRKNRENLPLLPNPYDAEFVRQLDDFIPHLEEAKFLGGEPFIIGVYYDIWDRMIELKPDIVTSITTNGSILNKRIKRIVERLNVIIVMSIDSMVRETYNKIRINSDFDQVQRSIEYYIGQCRAKGQRLAFATCPITLNWREMPDILKYCNDNDLSIFFNTVFHPRHVSLRYLPSTELAEIVDVYEQVMPVANTDSQRSNVRCFNDLVKQVKQWHREAVAAEEEAAKPDTWPDWHLRTEDKLRGDWQVSEVARQLSEQWQKADPNDYDFSFLKAMRAEVAEDYSFMNYFHYGVFLAYSDRENLDEATRADLRLKAEFLFQNWENYSDRDAYIEAVIATDPAPMMERAVAVPLEKMRYEPLLVVQW